jgi:tripartite-type tricarboxylate transporter receptor subunit TctC
MAVIPTLSPIVAVAQEQEGYFADRDVRIVFGLSPGGSYGLYSQLTARFLERHLPGNPNVITESMPGAGGLVAMNWLYNVAPRDGSVVAIVRAESVFETLVQDYARFDATQFNWIGRLVDLEFLGVASRGSGIDTLEDAKHREVVTGAADLKGMSATAPMMFNRLIGTRFRVVAGYAGSSRIFQGMEQGELDFFAMSWTSLKTAHRDKLERELVKPIFAYTPERIKELPDIPTVYEFVRSGEERAYLDLFSSAVWIGRSIVAPPGVPAEVISLLRTAFDDMLNDQEFRHEVEDRKIMIKHMAGSELETRISNLKKTAPEEIAAARLIYDELQSDARK